MRDTSTPYHHATEASDLHYDKGRHRHYNGIVFENGALVESFTPNIPEQVDALNSWREPGEERGGDGFEQAATALKRLILWAVQSDSDRPRHLSSIARRVVCLSFAVCPDSIPWKSLQEAATEFKCTKQRLGKYSREILELANGNFQRSGMFRSAESRARRAEISRRQWAGRRMTPEQKRQKRLAYVAAHPERRESELDRRRASYRARQAKLSRKNTLQTPKTP
jgi:hypothetical protein